jgi:hypothetical protein
MGILTVIFAVRGPAMPTDGWQVRFTAWLGHAAAVVERSLAWLPVWVPGIVILAALAGLLVLGVRHRQHGPAPEPGSEALSEDAGRAPTSKKSS